ncbi:hypothetical protein TI39_contig341g00015 [Zymoseptoria brevis]|uniref:F-box domain-containing protein n=1 Tax=Zymoseptoria brevis TaxID=1047168 RepID=A0A0F4GVA8_9PEZI|nr:hypothetical protein TI39_contig341g00015 [Zymoseptoria brevis]
MEDQNRGNRPALPKALATLLPPPEVATEAQTFRLFDMPDELWLRIGKMVIDDVPTINVRALRKFLWPKRGSDSYKYATYSATLTPPAILQTCAALRKELRNTYYREKVTVTASCTLGPHSYIILDRYLRMWTWGPQKGLLRPPPSGFKHWEWELMFTPTRVPAAHREDEDRRATRWEITFL